MVLFRVLEEFGFYSMIDNRLACTFILCFNEVQWDRKENAVVKE